MMTHTLICKKLSADTFVCSVDGKPYRFSKIVYGGREIDDTHLIIPQVENILFEGDSLIIEPETKVEVSETADEDEIGFLRRYYSMKIPTPEAMRKKKKIFKKYRTPEEKQKVYLDVIGGRPKKAEFCIYDVLDRKYFEEHGYEPKKAKNGEIYEFIKRKGSSSILALVDEEDGKYRVNLIMVYRGTDVVSPICVLNNGKYVTIGGKVRG